MKQLIFLFLLSLNLALTTQAQTAAPVADEAAVRSLVAAFNQAFNAHDVKAFAATFAEDADFTNWRGMSAHGRAKIEEFHVPVLTGLYKNATQKVTDTSVRFLTPAVAAVDVRTEVTGGMTPDGKEAPLLKFLLNWTAMKQANGQWLIQVMHNTRLMDPPAPVSAK